ncbi:MAG TPA: PQQ-binding-like beta-propeller repeat protein, partial [Anaerolineales bacterium]|nr:PQQ-binding-like beta-propeller repeat protein [Anaerolineales bacterium]
MKKVLFRILIALTALTALTLAACGAAPAESWSGVAVASDSDRVYVTQATHVYALKPNGSAYEKAWQFPVDNDSKIGPFYSDPAVVGDLVIVTSYNKSVYALSTDNGALQWEFPKPGETAQGW